MRISRGPGLRLGLVSCDDCARASPYCDRTLQALLKTFLDIIFLRKGPEHIPASWLVLAFSTLLMVLAIFSATTLIRPGDERDNTLIIASSLFALLVYAGVLLVTGFVRRLLPVLSSVIGCGAILTLLIVAEVVLLRPFLGARLTGIVGWLIMLWSVPVEGHIMARAIQQHWFVGIAIAITVFILQLGFQELLTRH